MLLERLLTKSKFCRERQYCLRISRDLRDKNRASYKSMVVGWFLFLISWPLFLVLPMADCGRNSSLQIHWKLLPRLISSLPFSATWNEEGSGKCTFVGRGRGEDKKRKKKRLQVISKEGLLFAVVFMQKLKPYSLPNPLISQSVVRKTNQCSGGGDLYTNMKRGNNKIPTIDIVQKQNWIIMHKHTQRKRKDVDKVLYQNPTITRIIWPRNKNKLLMDIHKYTLSAKYTLFWDQTI